MPQALIQEDMFSAAFLSQDTKWTLASNLTPAIPKGSLIPFCWSIAYSLARICKSLYPSGIAWALAAVITFSTSLNFTFLSFIGTTPSEFKPFELPPEIPT